MRGLMLWGKAEESLGIRELSYCRTLTGRDRFTSCRRKLHKQIRRRALLSWIPSIRSVALLNRYSAGHIGNGVRHSRRPELRWVQVIGDVS
jgi:hypothetical protein